MGFLDNLLNGEPRPTNGMSDEEWQERLTPEQYAVLRKSATETPGTGPYLHEHRDGVYHCAGCSSELFRSDAKFDSGSGWPSFVEPSEHGSVETRRDISYGMIRDEVVCATCGGHLGHVFADGPQERGGQRYCINGAALALEPEGSSPQHG